MSDLIYTPVSCVTANSYRENMYFQTCTMINYLGFEISIASDQSLCEMSDLDRTEIRVYKDDKDVTPSFIKMYNAEVCSDTNILTSSGQLHWIMDSIRHSAAKNNRIDVFKEYEEFSASKDIVLNK